MQERLLVVHGSIAFPTQHSQSDVDVVECFAQSEHSPARQGSGRMRVPDNLSHIVTSVLVVSTQRVHLAISGHRLQHRSDSQSGR